MDKKKLLKAKEEFNAKLQELAMRRSEGAAIELARIANMPYDAELPITSRVINEICKVANVEKGEDYEYFTIGEETKTVYTISSGGVTQTNVTPDSENELTFYSYNGPAENVYIEKLMEAKYSPLEIKQRAIMEALDRKETKDVLDVLIASAESESQEFSFDSDDSNLTFKKLEEMVRAINKYGSRFALITGSEVQADVTLLNYNEDKNQAVKLSDLGIDTVIPVNNFSYTHSGAQTVMPTDKAILVALSDSEDNRPVHFVRRKIQDIYSNGEDKQRIIVGSGPRLAVGSNPKWAYEIAVMEQYGVVQPNPFACAVFQRANSYS